MKATAQNLRSQRRANYGEEASNTFVPEFENYRNNCFLEIKMTKICSEQK